MNRLYAIGKAMEDGVLRRATARINKMENANESCAIGCPRG